MILFLDFRKAFDLNILVKKLQVLGITGKFFSSNKSYLSTWTQCAKFVNSFSTTQPVISGVPQGSILAPTLFLLFINDLLMLPLNCNAYTYADDTLYHLSHHDPSILQDLISCDLKLIDNWYNANKMSIYPTKSHYLTINPKPKYTLLSVQGTKLLEISFTKLLGFTVNNILTWDTHILTVMKVISQNLRLLFNICHLLNVYAVIQFYNNFMHPYLTYGVLLY